MFRERVAFIRDRLMVIAEDKEAREKFDIDQWVAEAAPDHAVPVTLASAPIDHSCGFAGCILGWAAHERWFEPWGYTATWNGMSTMLVYRTGGHPKHAYEPERPFAEILGVDPAVTNHIIYASNFYQWDNDAIDEVIERLTFLLDKGEDAFIDRYVPGRPD